MASEEPASRPASALPRLPEDALIILPVRNTVLFPGLVLPLTVGRKRSVAAAQAAARGDKPLGVLKQIDATSDTASELDLHRIGTIAAILRYVTAQDGAHHVIVQGLERFRIIEFLPGYPFFVARVERIVEQEELTPAIEARMHHLKREAAEALELLPQAPAELASAIEATASGARLADVIAGFMDIKPDEKQLVLATLDVQARLEKVDALLAQRLAVLRLSQEIENQTQAAMDKRQREYILREQLKAIQQALGETEPRAAETEDLRMTLDDANLPPEAKEQVERELARLERLPEAAAEYTMIRSYLDWMLALPWSVESEENIDINTARTVLDEDHYGLERIKRRILEYLAVRKLNPQGKSPILCFVGPPGVGKTSLGQSIARDRAQVHAQRAGRRARRGRDSRPSPHLRRRAARQHHSRHTQSRHAQSGVHARRDGQARRRLSRRPVRRAARGARPGAERDLPRQLPRRALRFEQGHVRRHGQCARQYTGPAARPHGGHRSRRLHRG